jgi:hypothetical protein
MVHSIHYNFFGFHMGKAFWSPLIWHSLCINLHMNEKFANDMQRAGTGFMLNPIDTILWLEEQGYTDNIVPCYDHFEVRSGAIKLYPDDFDVDRMIRYENTSDPEDQSIMYAISSKDKKVKGIYTESYGIYQDELEPKMLMKLQHASTEC